MSGPASVAVLGSGVVALSAAIAFRRALPAARVTLVERPTDPRSLLDRIGAATLAIDGFHRAIGLDQSLFIRRTGAVGIYRTMLDGVRLGAPGAIPHVEGVALHQLWLRSLAERPDATPDWAMLTGPGAEPFGVRFDMPAYRALLAEMAAALGIARGEAEDGALLLDCTTPGEDWIDAQLPNLIAEPIKSGGPEGEALTTSETGVEWQAPPWGWRLAQGDGLPAGRHPAPRAGRRIALGEAALVAESFDGHALSAAHADILRAIEFMPHAEPSEREAAEYNRRTAIAHQRMIDWATERWSGTPTDDLATLRRGFAARGRMPYRDWDPVTPGEWIGWWFARGVRPDRVDPSARAVPQDQLIRILERTR
ncbi:tryptophan 7-halogenase [Sphingomonas sp.]|jgi:tryptophan halogenase|uniref:tryptophan 7-halogenase n=1 Tax=Sphingomonas sp. TaxID=28214 RepID=UPI002E11A243|nr:tryptophan 7-halogenase [Sphingomonas sp.]HEV7288920.1 tryptophan 7-halogenase [Sphingomonas sp.]